MEINVIKQTKIWKQQAPAGPRTKTEIQSKTAMDKKPN